MTPRKRTSRASLVDVTAAAVRAMASFSDVSGVHEMAKHRPSEPIDAEHFIAESTVAYANVRIKLKAASDCTIEIQGNEPFCRVVGTALALGDLDLLDDVLSQPPKDALEHPETLPAARVARELYIPRLRETVYGAIESADTDLWEKVALSLFEAPGDLDAISDMTLGAYSEDELSKAVEALLSHKLVSNLSHGGYALTASGRRSVASALHRRGSRQPSDH
jgi:hypothetical protein